MSPDWRVEVGAYWLCTHPPSRAHHPPISFEVSVFELSLSPPILFILCYRPPKYNSAFITDFSDLLAEYLPRYDQGIILGDFNTHVCFLSNPLVRDFSDVLVSFVLQQLVNVPTHEHSHTLDLVLSFGLKVQDLVVHPVSFSDHFSVVFNISAMLPVVRRQAPRYSWHISPSMTASLLSILEVELSNPSSSGITTDVDGLLNSFNLTCSDALDTVAPLKLKRKKTTSDPWLNNETRSLRRRCRALERRWKKDKLLISQQLLVDALDLYQRSVRSARNKYFACIISQHQGDQHKLYSTVNSILSITEPGTVGPSVSLAVSQFRVCILPRPDSSAGYVTAPRLGLSQFEDSFKCGRRMRPSFRLNEGWVGCILQ
ncbi:uncharacterized protein [Nothobranchius furzeri]|uniref:uncharacterized protein isoform X1 n=1 Tax=Nothobranchius furzeri TaxID=105023 RepID=UPI003904B85B